MRAIRDQHARNARVHEVLHRKLRHLSSADQQDDAIFQGSEDLSPELDGDEAHRHRVESNRRLGANAFRRRESRLHECREVPTDRPGVEADAISFAHLTEDLRLTDNHRIEARRDAEEMPDRGQIPVNVDVFLEVDSRQAAGPPQHVHHPIQARVVGAASRDNLDAIARRDNQRLVDRLSVDEIGERGPQFGIAEGQLLTDVNRGGAVVDAKKQNAHIRQHHHGDSEWNPVENRRTVRLTTTRPNPTMAPIAARRPRQPDVRR